MISAGSFESSDENKAVILKPLDILTTGADADIYSTLETLPGTQQIGETDGLFVRGGSASETKTLIDEMTVQNPFTEAYQIFLQEAGFRLCYLKEQCLAPVDILRNTVRLFHLCWF